MNKVIKFLFFFYPLFFFGQSDTNWQSKKNKIVIPFELSNNLIVVNVNLNGSNLKMILDTGADLSVLFGSTRNDSVKINSSRETKITGIGINKPINAIISDGNHLKIKEYEDPKFSLLLINDDNINLVDKFGVEINGIIGSSFFQNGLIKINYQRKKIYVYKSKNQSYKNRLKKYVAKDISFYQNKPFIELNLASDTVIKSHKLLLDTGLSEGLWLFKNNLSDLNNQKTITDYLGLGLSGEISGKRARLKELEISNFKFQDVLVAYPDSIFFANIDLSNGREGIIGGEILKRFHIIFDYSNKKIYLKKNNLFKDPFEFNMSGIEIRKVGNELIQELVELNMGYTGQTDKKIYNSRNKNYVIKSTLKPSYYITNIRKDSPAFYANLAVGDRLLSINNKKSRDLTLQKINELFQSEDGKKINMEVERFGIIFEVEFYLKKII